MVKSLILRSILAFSYHSTIPLPSTVQTFCLNVCVCAALHFAVTQETNFNEVMIGKVHLCLLHAACITSQPPTFSAIVSLKVKTRSFQRLYFIFNSQES